jgi:hypothetical protein
MVSNLDGPSHAQRQRARPAAVADDHQECEDVAGEGRWRQGVRVEVCFGDGVGVGMMPALWGHSPGYEVEVMVVDVYSILLFVLICSTWFH